MALDPDIANLDLEPVAFKALLEEGWSVEEVDRNVLLYRGYLQAIRNSDKSFRTVPTKEIDIVWHHHILDTQKYMEDCERLFGRYVHHFPYSGLLGGEDEVVQREGGRRTLEQIREILG